MLLSAMRQWIKIRLAKIQLLALLPLKKQQQLQHFGFEALEENTTGGNNVAVGRVCLGSNTTGQRMQLNCSALGVNTTGGDMLQLGKQRSRRT